jgi:ABC-type antimicrobial peptide transport system permease subunit
LLKSTYAEKVEQAGFAALSVGFLGVVALLLACIGIFGLTAFVVSLRSKEIGIRMALGATPMHVMAVVLRQFSIPLLVGLLAGVGGAAALSQIMRQELYGVSAFDPTAYLASVTFFGAGIALAALLPAKRALRIDPMSTLRHD